MKSGKKPPLVGINGAGKSTLFKIIVGELPPDSGQVILAKGKTMGYLAQHQELTSDLSIYDALLQVKQHILDMEVRMRQLEKEMKYTQGEELNKIMEAYSRLTHEFELENGYAYKSELTGVLKGLGFAEEDFRQNDFHTFRGTENPCGPWPSSSYPSRISSFWTSLPTIWTWIPLRGWKPIF